VQLAGSTQQSSMLDSVADALAVAGLTTSTLNYTMFQYVSLRMTFDISFNVPGRSPFFKLISVLMTCVDGVCVNFTTAFNIALSWEVAVMFTEHILILPKTLVGGL